MITEALLVVLTLVLLCQTLLRKPRGLPPGRWGLPLVGSVPLTKKSFERHLSDLRRQHGDIYLWRIGTQNVVFLHDYHMAKEAFTRPEFLNRPDWSIFKLMVSDNNAGVVGSNGATWHTNRRFTLRQLRDLGMGKSRMVSVVQREAQCLVEELGKQAGRAAPVPHALTVCILNVLWQLVGSKRFCTDDPVILELEMIIDDTLANMPRLTVPDFLPWLSFVFPLALQKRLFALDILDVMKEKFSRFCQDLITEHRQGLDPNNPRDLIDAYIIDQQEQHGVDDITSSKDLSKLIFDMFTAGSETTTNTLTWMLYYLAAFPDVQRKMQEEVDTVLPLHTLPTLEDRPSLPYTEAVIHEVHRFASVTSLGVQHCATKDTMLAGYHIPKGAVLMSVVGTMHRDPRYWQNPNSFRPERWLDQEGKFSARQEGFLPFGVGKRRCVAESLVKMELLIFACALVQRLEFSPPPGRLMDLRPDTRNPLCHLARMQDIWVAFRV